MKTVESNSEFLSNALEKAFSDGKPIDTKVQFQKDPAFQSFKFMFHEIRDRFLFSNEYGLDAYLSTRIRHGAFLNHIRSVFESLDLITQKDINGEYAVNENWNSGPSEYQNETLQKALAKFSKEIDDYSTGIKEELLQIKTELNLEKPNGLFSYVYLDESYRKFYLLTQEEEDLTYEDFVNIVIKALMNVTDMNLSSIRALFKDGIKNKFLEIIDSLENSLKDLNSNHTSELSSRLALSRTNLQSELDIISEWFQFTQQDREIAFTLTETIEMAVTITNNIRPNYIISPNIHIEDDANLFSEFYQSFLYITRIMLDNVIIHSKVEADEQTVDINIKISADDVLEYKMTSKVAPSEVEKALERLTSVKSRWGSKELTRVAQECDSGYVKIKRMRKFDLNRKRDSFDFILEDGKMTIIIKMELKDAFI